MNITRTRHRSQQPGHSWLPGSTPVGFKESFSVDCATKICHRRRNFFGGKSERPCPYPSPLPFAPPSTVSTLRSRHARGGGFPFLPRHIRKSRTSDMAAAPKIGARQRQLCLFACSLQPAPCSDKTSHPVAHLHNTVACHNTSLPTPSRPHPCIS